MPTPLLDRILRLRATPHGADELHIRCAPELWDDIGFRPSSRKRTCSLPHGTVSRATPAHGGIDRRWNRAA